MESGFGDPVGFVGNCVWMESVVARLVQYLPDGFGYFSVCIIGKTTKKTDADVSGIVLSVSHVYPIYIVGNGM